MVLFCVALVSQPFYAGQVHWNDIYAAPDSCREVLCRRCVRGSGGGGGIEQCLLCLSSNLSELSSSGQHCGLRLVSIVRWLFLLCGQGVLLHVITQVAGWLSESVHTSL